MSFHNYSPLTAINYQIQTTLARISSMHLESLNFSTESPKHTFIGNFSVREDCWWADQEILHSKISPKIMTACCQITCTIPWLPYEQLPYPPEHPRVLWIRQRDKSEMPLLTLSYKYFLPQHSFFTLSSCILQTHLSGGSIVEEPKNFNKIFPNGSWSFRSPSSGRNGRQLHRPWG